MGNKQSTSASGDMENARKNAPRKRSTSDVKIRKAAFLRNSLDSRWGELTENNKLSAIFDIARLGLSSDGQNNSTENVDEIAYFVKRLFEEKDRQMKSLEETRRDEMARYQILFNDNQTKMYALEQEAIDEIQSLHIQNQSLLEENKIFVDMFRRQQINKGNQFGQTRKRQAPGEQVHVHKEKSIRLSDETCVLYVSRPRCYGVRGATMNASDIDNVLELSDGAISDGDFSDGAISDGDISDGDISGLEWDYDANDLQDDIDSLSSLESEGSNSATSSDGSATDNIDVRDGYEKKEEVQRFKDQGIVNPRK